MGVYIYGTTIIDYYYTQTVVIKSNREGGKHKTVLLYVSARTEILQPRVTQRTAAAAAAAHRADSLQKTSSRFLFSIHHTRTYYTFSSLFSLTPIYIVFFFFFINTIKGPPPPPPPRFRLLLIYILCSRIIYNNIITDANFFISLSIYLFLFLSSHRFFILFIKSFFFFFTPVNVRVPISVYQSKVYRGPTAMWRSFFPFIMIIPFHGGCVCVCVFSHQFFFFFYSPSPCITKYITK